MPVLLTFAILNLSGFRPILIYLRNLSFAEILRLIGGSFRSLLVECCCWFCQASPVCLFHSIHSCSPSIHARPPHLNSHRVDHWPRLHCASCVSSTCHRSHRGLNRSWSQLEVQQIRLLLRWVVWASNSGCLFSTHCVLCHDTIRIAWVHIWR